MTKTLTGYLLKFKDKKRLVVGTERTVGKNGRFKMKDGCFIELKDWDGKGKIETWAREQYVKKDSDGEVLDVIYFDKDTVESPTPYHI